MKKQRVVFAFFTSFTSMAFGISDYEKLHKEMINSYYVEPIHFFEGVVFVPAFFLYLYLIVYSYYKEKDDINDSELPLSLKESRRENMSPFDILIVVLKRTFVTSPRRFKREACWENKQIFNLMLIRFGIFSLLSVLFLFFYFKEY